jgi:hypothetical protein
MLSEVIGQIKEKAEDAEIAVSNRESRARPLRKVRGEGWATRHPRIYFTAPRTLQEHKEPGTRAPATA